VLNGFAEFIRNLLLSKDEKVASLVEVVESFRQRYQQMSATCSTGYLVSALNILAEAEINFKSARNKRLHVELALIKLCYLQQALSVVADSDKKKQTDLRPLNFRVIQPVRAADTASSNPVEEKAPAQIIPQVMKQAPVQAPPIQPVTKTASGPKLIIEDQLIAEKKTGTGKLGSLQKLRQQVSSTTQNSKERSVIFITAELLQAAWQEFIEQLKVNRNPAVQSFELAELRVVNEEQFTVVTPNNLQQKFIDGERIALTDYLQQRFHNRRLSYQVVVEQREDLNIKIEAPLNSRERFQQLAEQFPLIKDLKDRLKLELDY
jgi:DNA polymerase-3 subunit gamma/tau